MKNLSYKLKINRDEKATVVIEICYKGKKLKWREQAESFRLIAEDNTCDAFESAVIRKYGKKKGNKIIEKICKDFEF